MPSFPRGLLEKKKLSELIKVGNCCKKDLFLASSIFQSVASFYYSEFSLGAPLHLTPILLKVLLNFQCWQNTWNSSDYSNSILLPSTIMGLLGPHNSCTFSLTQSVQVVFSPFLFSFLPTVLRYFFLFSNFERFPPPPPKISSGFEPIKNAFKWKQLT